MDDQQLRYELDVGAVVMRESILRVVNTLKSGGARGGAGSGAGDKLLRGSGGARKTNKGESPYEKERRRAEKRRQRKLESEAVDKDTEVKMLVRVSACIAALAVLYNILAQSLQNWHNRSVMMKGSGEKISFDTVMGLWTFKSTGHYHNDNMCVRTHFIHI